MKDQELDALMRRVLLDSAKDGQAEAREADTPGFTPSPEHRRQMEKMLADPVAWARTRARPLWAAALRRVAAVLLALSLGFAGVLAVSPTARAGVARWAIEWYEDRVVYRYGGNPISGELPKYELTALPEEYVENKNKRIETPASAFFFYECKNKSDIFFNYVYIQQGAANVFSTDDAEIRQVTVNGYEGQLYLTKHPERARNTVTWIDPETNIQFTVHAPPAEDILHIAESVSLCKTTK